MDSMDNVRERFEALEQQTEQLQRQTHTLEVHTPTVKGRLRWWRLTWCVAAEVALGLALALLHTVQAAPPVCGCYAMTLAAHDGVSNIYCYDAASGHGIPMGCHAVTQDPRDWDYCPAGRAYECPLGKITPDTTIMNPQQFGWRFEIVGSFTADTTDITSCTTGQAARGQWDVTRINGNAFGTYGKARAEPTPTAAPDGGLPIPAPFMKPSITGPLLSGNGNTPSVGLADTPKWAADKYTTDDRGGWIYRRLQTTSALPPQIPVWIQWIDAPFITLEPGLGQWNWNTFSYEGQQTFVSWMTGPLGTCWCKFSIHNKWVGGQRPARTVGTITLDDGVNCTAP